MKKLLLQLDSSRLPSVFDQVVAYDAGADAIMSYGNVSRERCPRPHPRLHLHPRRQGPEEHRGVDRRQQHDGRRTAARHGGGRHVQAAHRVGDAGLQRLQHHRGRGGREDRAGARRPEGQESGDPRRHRPGGPALRRPPGPERGQGDHHLPQAGAGREGAPVHQRPLRRRRRVDHPQRPGRRSRQVLEGAEILLNSDRPACRWCRSRPGTSTTRSRSPST